MVDAADKTSAHERGARRQVHWKKTRRLTSILLVLWLFTGFCTIYFARELSHLTVFGWPLSFYMAAQGASLIYLGLIGFYAWKMRRLDRQYTAVSTDISTEDNRR